MKNQYFGDVKDYLTYGLLRTLAQSAGLRIGVAWMLTEDRLDRQGEQRGYLKRPEQWREYDPVLYDLLARVETHGRTVDFARRFDLLPGASYFDERVPGPGDLRRAYFQRLFFALEGCELLFFDPDNGLETRTTPRGPSRSVQHLYWDEVEQAYHQQRHSLLIFQHFPRRARQAYLQERAEDLSRCLGVARVDWFESAQVAFFLVARPEHAGALEKVPAAVRARWGERLQPSRWPFIPAVGKPAVSSEAGGEPRPASSGLRPASSGLRPASSGERLSPPGLDLVLLPGQLAVCRLAPDAAIPAWAGGPLVSITRTSEELSIVCAQGTVPEGVRAEGGWRALRVNGPLDFALVGILAGLAAPLAKAGISLFALSTYDTDTLLVKEASLPGALEALRAAGHRIAD